MPQNQRPERAPRNAPQRKAPPKRRPLTREERLEKERRERALREEREQQRRLRRKRRGQIFRTSFLLSLVFVLLYWCFVAITIARRGPDDDNALPILVYTEGKRSEDRKFSVEKVRHNGADYLPVSFLEDYTVLTEFGDHQTRSIQLADNGQYATFYLNSSTAVVNGQRLNLSANAFLEGDELYLPVDFYTTQMTPFTLTRSAPLAANVLTVSEKKDFAFRLCEALPLTPVDRSTRPAPVG